MRRPDIAGWSSLVARRAHNPEVVGSNPAPATKNLQLVGLAGELFCYSGTVFSVQFSASQTKSRSVTSRPDLGGQVLQIEMLSPRLEGSSKSVTRGTDFAELLLQIEILRRDGFGLSRSVPMFPASLWVLPRRSSRLCCSSRSTLATSLRFEPLESRSRFA